MLPDVGMEASTTAPHRKPILEAEGTRLVHQRRLLPDETVTYAVQRLQIDLFWRRSSTKRIVGRVTASAMAAASTVSV